MLAMQDGGAERTLGRANYPPRCIRLIKGEEYRRPALMLEPFK